MTLKQAVEQNRKWLKIYSILFRLIGWSLIVGGCGIAVFSGSLLEMEEARINSLPTFLTNIPLLRSPETKFMLIIHNPFVGMFLPGVLVLLVTHLLDFLLDENLQAGKLLKNGQSTLQITAGFVLLDFSPALWHLRNFQNGEGYSWVITSIFIGVSLLHVCAKLAILIGLAQALRRVLPMIEEAKSLV
jgi:hypothetical protein